MLDSKKKPMVAGIIAKLKGSNAPESDAPPDDEGSEDEGGSSDMGLDSAAEDALTAIKSGDASALRDALKSFIDMYDPDDQDENSEPPESEG